MGKLIKISLPNATLQACNVIHKGGIIAYPTDTVYGFGCDSKNETAIIKLNKLNLDILERIDLSRITNTFNGKCRIK